MKVIKAVYFSEYFNMSSGAVSPENEVHVYKLQKNYKAILENMIAEDVMDYLVQEQVFSFDDLQRVSCQQTMRDKNEKLVEILIYKGPGAYDIFIKVLRDSGSSFLAEILENTPRPFLVDQDVNMSQNSPSHGGNYKLSMNLHHHKINYH